MRFLSGFSTCPSPTPTNPAAYITLPNQAFKMQFTCSKYFTDPSLLTKLSAIPNICLQVFPQMAPLCLLNIIYISLFISYTLRNSSIINIPPNIFKQSLLFAVLRQDPHWKASQFEGTIIFHEHEL